MSGIIFSHYRQPEVRESQASIVAELLESQARGQTIPQGRTAVEASTRWYWAAGLAMGEISPENGRTAGVTPAFMASLGVALHDFGQQVYLIDIQNGEIVLHQAAAWEVMRGGRYRVDIARPETTETHTVREDGVLHFRILTPRTAPWSGRAPITETASVSSKLLAALEVQFRGQAEGAHGTLIGAPDGSDFSQLQEDLSELGGGAAFLPISYEEDSPGSRSQNEFMPRQIRFSPDQNSVVLRRHLCEEIAAGSGVPNALLVASTDGTKSRESWRQLQFGLLEPLARQLIPEMRRKLGEPALRIDFHGLAAADIASRARAARDLVGAGWSMQDARDFVGLTNA